MSNMIDKAFGIHPLALSLRSQRAEVLASNLANDETPGYKARDMDFEAVLRRSMGESQGLELKATHARHIGRPGVNTDPELLYRIPAQPALDGNTVETDEEQAKFTENALAYEASLRFINGRISGLMTAIKGQ
ncbi:MAG: flagellar basal body rod protein FlgB [Methylococcaceae bacterium]|nr:MAG: flagellar basal body rod protein FlgB [Methylococcaceae bacterium]